MKLIKKGFFFLSSALVLTALVSCGNKDDKKKDETTTSDVTPTSTSTDDFDNELAISNFAKNIENCNYVVKGNDFEISVASNDAVSFDYDRGREARDFVVMSVEDEVFQAFPNGDQLDWLLFVQYGSSVEACAKKGKVLNYMTDIFGDNMFNAFTSLQSEDGLYISNSGIIQDMVQAMGSYSDLIYGSMKRTYLKIDDEQATSAHLTTHVFNEAGRLDFDIVMDITFGDATVNELAQAWLDNPQYPDNPPTWTNNQVGAIDFIFKLWPYEQSGLALPFIQGASYGLYMDMNEVMQGGIYIEDRHMTKLSADNYIDLLTSKGFAEAEDENGATCYRKLLRAESNCYSEVYVDYSDNVFYLYASKYYEYTHDTALATINGNITLPKSGSFPELKNDNNIISFDGKDTLMHEREAYLYLNEYDLVYNVDIKYNDTFDVNAYIDEYINRLEAAGFIFIRSEADPRFSDETGDINFRFNINDATNTLNLKFKTKKRYSLFEVNNVLEDYPDLILGNEIYYFTAHNAIDHQYIMTSREYDLNFRLDVYYNTDADANAFLAAYLEALEAAGYTRVSNAGTGRKFEYKNADGYIFGYDVAAQKDDTVGVLMTFAKETE